MVGGLVLLEQFLREAVVVVVGRIGDVEKTEISVREKRIIELNGVVVCVYVEHLFGVARRGVTSSTSPVHVLAHALGVRVFWGLSSSLG